MQHSAKTNNRVSSSGARSSRRSAQGADKNPHSDHRKPRDQRQSLRGNNNRQSAGMRIAYDRRHANNNLVAENCLGSVQEMMGAVDAWRERMEEFGPYNQVTETRDVDWEEFGSDIQLDESEGTTQDQKSAKSTPDAVFNARNVPSAPELVVKKPKLKKKFEEAKVDMDYRNRIAKVRGYLELDGRSEFDVAKCKWQQQALMNIVWPEELLKCEKGAKTHRSFLLLQRACLSRRNLKFALGTVGLGLSSWLTAKAKTFFDHLSTIETAPLTVEVSASALSRLGVGVYERSAGVLQRTLARSIGSSVEGVFSGAGSISGKLSKIFAAAAVVCGIYTTYSVFARCCRWWTSAKIVRRIETDNSVDARAMGLAHTDIVYPDPQLAEIELQGELKLLDVLSIWKTSPETKVVSLELYAHLLGNNVIGYGLGDELVENKAGRIIQTTHEINYSRYDPSKYNENVGENTGILAVGFHKMTADSNLYWLGKRQTPVIA